MTAAGATPGGHPAVRLQRTPLERAPQLAQLVAALAGSERPFLLHGRWGRPLGDAPRAPIIVAGTAPVRVLAPTDDPLAALEQLPPLEGPVPDGAIGGGIVGWLGFRCAQRAERTAGPWPPRPAEGADAQLAWYRDVLRRDEHGQWWVEALLPAAEAAALDAIAGRWRARLDAAPAQPPAGTLGPFELHRGPASHRAAVAETIERVAAGELFQANVCLRLDAHVDGDRAALVAPVLEQTDPWYGGWIEAAGGRALLSASPELFLRRRGRDVETAPIKGTAPRTAAAADPVADPAARSLLESAKDRAEHVMILDLMRNDLGRVCDYGSIRAELKPRVEAHAGVWHLVSSVSGTLHDGMGDERLLRATFPPGSVTGAPKVQAMRVIAAVEGSGREAYTGAHGIVSPASGLEFAVTIRSLEFDGPRAWLGAGGGIVADSLPEAELQEALRKAGGILGAAGTQVRESAPATAADLGAVPWLQSTDRRPDARGGLVETMLVQGGRAEHAGAHLQRLTHSMRALGLGEPPPDLLARVHAAAGDAATGAPQRLRVIVRPAPAAATTDLQLAPLGAAGPEVLLRPVIVPGGLGPHKWLDRTLLESLTLRLGASPLLLDADGSVLETAWANLWWLDGKTLCTPPLDGRQLPGVSRARLLARAAAAGLPVAERAGHWNAALAAAPLLLTSARGITPARLETTPPAVLARAHAAAERLSPLLAATAAAGV